jgi:YD repeat-containing protein
VVLTAEAPPFIAPELCVDLSTESSQCADPWTHTIDGLGNLTVLSSPDTGSTTNTYDAAGNLKTSKDARGDTTTYIFSSVQGMKQETGRAIANSLALPPICNPVE